MCTLEVSHICQLIFQNFSSQNSVIVHPHIEYVCQLPIDYFVPTHKTLFFKHLQQFTWQSVGNHLAQVIANTQMH
jgi:hypothetical protein